MYPYNKSPEHGSEGGMIRLETLIEVKFLHSSFSSSNFSIRAFRAYPLVEIRQTVPRRAILGNGISVNSTSDLSQRYLDSGNGISVNSISVNGISVNSTPSHSPPLKITRASRDSIPVAARLKHKRQYIYIYIYIYNTYIHTLNN